MFSSLIWSPSVELVSHLWSHYKLLTWRVVVKESFLFPEKTCGSPGQVDNGEIEYLTGNEFGDKIVVNCNTGLVIWTKIELALNCVLFLINFNILVFFLDVVLGWWGDVNSPVEIKAGWAGYLNVKVCNICGAPDWRKSNSLISILRDVLILQWWHVTHLLAFPMASSALLRMYIIIEKFYSTVVLGTLPSVDPSQ